MGIHDTEFEGNTTGKPRKEASMLVLSRQRDESIVIGDNIVVTIVDIRGDKVRLGINAPSEIPKISAVAPPPTRMMFMATGA